jgi:hypothetical protein
MSTGKVAIVVLVACLAIGGGIAALTDIDDDAPVEAIDLDDGVLRRDDAVGEIAGADDDDDRNKDGDRTKGNDGTGGGNNTGDGDGTNGNDGTSDGNNTGDGDRTNGNDGTGGGDNTGYGDATDGNDGTGGGNNTGDVTYDAPAGSATRGDTT